MTLTTAIYVFAYIEWNVMEFLEIFYNLNNTILRIWLVLAFED